LLFLFFIEYTYYPFTMNNLVYIYEKKWYTIKIELLILNF